MVINRRYIVVFTIYFFIGVFLSSNAKENTTQKFNDDRVKPYSINPRYWQYKGKPVLLLGATNNDNLFQLPNVEGHLDTLKSIGGNYVRNTMSGRSDKGFEVYPFKKMPDGRYDLEQWNDEYWNRFENFLESTYKRDIIVQIELWAFHDFNEAYWEDNPWHPANNINYDSTNTSLKGFYGSFTITATHDFFFTIPKLNNDSIVLYYQQKFIDKVLSYTLQYGHVIYCMTNEIHPFFPPEWGWYWSDYIRKKAGESGKSIETTEMFWKPDLKHEQHSASLNRPDTYTFLEASQNSAKNGQENWDNLQYVYQNISLEPRPINHVKIYGGDKHKNKAWDNQHAAECFWSNIIGGSASSRFHRPHCGIGFSQFAKSNIKSLRNLCEKIDLFACSPQSNLLDDREPNEAYCMANPGKQYVVYFPDTGQVELDISSLEGLGSIRWLDVSSSTFSEKKPLKPGHILTLSPPKPGAWVAIVANDILLPYGACPKGAKVIYDNDQTLDVYTDEILMAMASSKTINLLGMITSRTIIDVGYNKYDEFAAQRQHIVDIARESGMRYLPDPVKGAKKSLQQPESAKIEDTKSIGTEGSWLIVDEARKASPENPLVIICGGQLTIVADAYLLDPSIKDNIIVAALLGKENDMDYFNGKMDPWADYIVLQRLIYVQFPQRRFIPKVPKNWIKKNLPDSPLKEWMFRKVHPLFPDIYPGNEDNDGQPVIPFLTYNYVNRVKRVSFGGWKKGRFGDVTTYIPMFAPAKKYDKSRAFVVIDANTTEASLAWQKAMANPDTW